MTTRKKFPEFETERLCVRQLVDSDTEPWFKNLSDKEVADLIGMAPLTEVKEAKEFIEYFNSAFEKGRSMGWAIALKEDNSFIGTVSYEKIDHENMLAEIGYDLVKEYWGQGFMTEALKPILTYGFEELKLHRIEAHTAAMNGASRRLLERLGFTKEGQLRECTYINGAFRDDVHYGMLKKEWELLKK